MKKRFLSIALTAIFSVFAVATYAMVKAPSPLIVCEEGGHKCDDTCKKDKDGKCAEVKKEKKRKKTEAKTCATDGKSCSSKCANSSEKKKSDTDPKS